MADPSWRDAVQVAAPALATALGGPLAGVAATVVARTVLGAGEGEQTTIAAAQEALQQATLTPEGLAKIKAAEVELKRVMADLEIKLAESGAADRANARQMAAIDPWTPRVLAAFLCLAWLTINIYAMIHGIPYEVREMVSRGIGALDGLMASVFLFYFGSSAGSKLKTEALAAVVSQQTADDLNGRELNRVRGR